MSGKQVSLSKMAADFDKMAGTTAEEAARQIVRAIEKNTKRLLIGPDAKVLDLMQRLLPNHYDNVMGVGTKLLERLGKR
jgi:predicted RNA-binding protein Jag